MPELPEAETIRRDLQKRIVGQTVTQIEIFDPRVVMHKNLKDFQKIKGKQILEVIRFGKIPVLKLSGGLYLAVHLKMTGQLIYGEHLKQAGLKETKVVFSLSSGKFLNFNDQRLFGRLVVTDDLSTVSFVKDLGPDPLTKEVDSAWLGDHLKGRTTPIKILLLKQDFLAGIGNIYDSEILFKSRINPLKPAGRLTREEIKRLAPAIKEVLNEAIDFRGTSMRNYRDSEGKKGLFNNRIKVYGREGEPCFVCGKKIVRTVQAARSTFYCRNCQSV